MRLSELGLAEAAWRIESCETTAETLASACLERVGERDETVRAWACVDRSKVLEQARALDRAPRRSRLHGVPIGIKDIIDTADQPT
jgi:Asp-tRNA(Asn)/Glu-tRNA(Gln) amidotransferase A subunit family amidase